MRAYLRGVRDYVGSLKDGKIAGPNAPEVIRMLAEMTGIKDRSLLEDMTPHWCDPNGMPDKAALAKDLAFFKTQGVPATLNVSDVLDLSYAKAAAAELGLAKPQP